jgi:Uma2 family endonuclease
VGLKEKTVSEAMLPQLPVTIGEFDAFLDGQQDARSWELVAGRIFAMTNPTEVHEQIASNMGAPLKLAMDPKGCRVYQFGIGIQRSDNEQGIDRPRPDVLVRCGRLGTRNFVTDPLVVVEVLSPSTMDVDRGDKVCFYKALPTLRHIVLVYQDQMRIEHYRKTDIGRELESLTQPEEFLRFEAAAFEIMLEQVYFGVELNSLRRLSAR